MPRLIVLLSGCLRFGATGPLLFPGAANLPTGRAGSAGRIGNSGLYGRGWSYRYAYAPPFAVFVLKTGVYIITVGLKVSVVIVGLHLFARNRMRVHYWAHGVV